MDPLCPPRQGTTERSSVLFIARCALVCDLVGAIPEEELGEVAFVGL